MNRISIALAATTLLAMAAGPVTAATEPDAWEEQINRLFVQLDRNGDGVIDVTEAGTHKGLANAFPRIARDGRLDRPQFMAWYKVYDMEPAQE